MRLFKPYVNLTKVQDTAGVDQYTLHSVINLPVGYHHQSTTQEEIATPEGQKKWKITLAFEPNGSTPENTMMQEFNIALLEGPAADRNKIQISIKTNGEATGNQPGDFTTTDVNYDDAAEGME